MKVFFLLLQLANIPVQITHGGNINGWPAVSPDGKLVAYILNQGGDQNVVHLYDCATRGEKTLNIPNGIDGGMVFSPDNKSLYYNRRDFKRRNITLLMQIPLSGGTPKVIADDVDSPVSFSPDGKSIAFQRDVPNAGRYLIVASLNGGKEQGGKERTLAFWKQSEPKPQEPAWSPDGKEIAVATRGRNSKLLFIPASGKGETRELAVAGGVVGIVWPLQMKSGGLYASLGRNSQDGTLQLWRLDVASKQWTQITNDPAGYQNGRISSSADGSLVAAVRLELIKTGMDDLLNWVGAAKGKPRANPNVVLIRPPQ